MNGGRCARRVGAALPSRYPATDLEKEMATRSDDNSSQPGNTRRSWFAGLAALGGLGLLGAPAYAQGWRHGRGLDPEERAHRLDWRMSRLVREAGGTPQQKDRLVAIVT